MTKFNLELEVIRLSELNQNMKYNYQIFSLVYKKQIATVKGQAKHNKNNI